MLVFVHVMVVIGCIIMHFQVFSHLCSIDGCAVHLSKVIQMQLTFKEHLSW